MKRLLFALLLLPLIFAHPLYAQQTTCQKIYGGGITTQTSCPPAAQTPSPSQDTTTPTIPPTSKGGLPVYQSGQVEEMPASGPEALVLGALPALGLLGVYLRRKTI